LDEYLGRNGQRWVVRLREEMERVDYTSLEVNYLGGGRPPFHPRTLLGLIVYAVLKRSWSLREIEDLALMDIGAWWMTGGHQPDHSTLGEFLNRHAQVLSEEFLVSLVQQLARRAGLGKGLVAGDGTVLEAAASRLSTLKREAAQMAAQQAAEEAVARPNDAEAAAHAEQAVAVAKAVEERAQEREFKGLDGAQTQVAVGEIEAVIQPRKDGALRPGYKPSLWVHESGLIVAQALHPSSETAVMPQLMSQHQSIFGAPPSILLLDAGYCSPGVLKPLADSDVDVLCPSGKAGREDDWEKSQGDGLYSKSAFTYETDQNIYRCPGGHELQQVEQSHDGAGRPYRRYGTSACATCPVRARCTISKSGRTVKRYQDEEYKEAMAQVLRQPRARERYRRRAPTVERAFAELRCRQGLTRFHRRGGQGASLEFALHCIAFDLKWAIGSSNTLIFGFIALIAAEDVICEAPIIVVLHC
jgi:transposase